MDRGQTQNGDIQRLNQAIMSAMEVLRRGGPQTSGTGLGGIVQPRGGGGQVTEHVIEAIGERLRAALREAGGGGPRAAGRHRARSPARDHP